MDLKPIFKFLASKKISCSELFILGSLFLSLYAQAEDFKKQSSHMIRLENTERTAFLKIEFLREDIVRFESGEKALEHEAWKDKIWESPMLQKQKWPYADILSSKDHVYETEKLKVHVHMSDLCITVRDKVRNKDLGRFCPRRLNHHWKQLEIHSEMKRNVYGLGQYFKNPGSSDGDWMGQVWDPLNYTMGNALRPFNGGASGYTMFPVAYVLGHDFENYGIFLDNIYKQMWSFDKSTWTVDMFGDQIRWYVFQGETLPDLRKTYMSLVGHSPIPPVEAFGLWVSRFGFENWNQIERELQGLRQNHFPIEGFALDLQWFGGKFYHPGSPEVSRSRMGTLEFDREKFPNPEATLKQFAERESIQFMPIEEPYIAGNLKEHQDLSSRNFLARNCHNGEATYIDYNPWWGKGGMLDWTNPSAGSYWHETKRKPLIDLGIRFHWTDLGEPEMYRDYSCYYGFPEIAKHRHPDIHNIYNLKWSESIDEGYKRHHPNERHFTLSRSGTSGIQRFGAGMWSGDIAANMGALTAHMQTQGHLSLSGLDYYGSDIGGFHRSPSTLDGDEGELYTQWFANSCLFDFPVRPHVWAFDSTRETSPARIGQIRSNLANIRLRYELFPYYYSLAWRAYKEASAIVAPMVYEFQNDPKLRTVGHQKMIGPYLMAALVARYGEEHRNVYLPKGNWVSWHTGEFFEGKDDFIRDVPTHYHGRFHIPLFIRAGAIIPSMEVSENSRNLKDILSQENRAFAVKILPDHKATDFDIYEDDYTTKSYQSGDYFLTSVHQELKANTVHIRISPTEGPKSRSERSRSYIVKVLLNKKAVETVRVNGREFALCSMSSDSEAEDCWQSIGQNETKISIQSLNDLVVKDILLSFR